MKFKKRVAIDVGLRQIDIAPLIDCMFLLLIFFMLTSSFIPIAGINIRLPKTLTLEEVDARTLTIAISSEDIIYLEDKPLTVKEAENVIEKRSYNFILIKADKDASVGAVVGVWDMCKRLGIERIGIAAVQER